MDLYPAYERSHLLSRMPAPERRFLTSIAEEVQFEDGTFLFRAGEPAERFYVVGRGRVELLGPTEQVVDILGPGEMVGVSWFYPDREWSLSARARRGFIGVCFPAEGLRARCEVDERLRLIVLDELNDLLFERLTRARASLIA